jgi:hypothetical protein
MQFADQGIDLAQIFPATFLRLQLSVPHKHREVADLVLAFAR